MTPELLEKETTVLSSGEEDMRQFLSEIRQYPRLTPEQERELLYQKQPEQEPGSGLPEPAGLAGTVCLSGQLEPEQQGQLPQMRQPERQQEPVPERQKPVQELQAAP